MLLILQVIGSLIENEAECRFVNKSTFVGRELKLQCFMATVPIFIYLLGDLGEVTSLNHISVFLPVKWENNSP